MAELSTVAVTLPSEPTLNAVSASAILAETTGGTTLELRRKLAAKVFARTAAYDAVAPNPDDFFPFLERLQPVVHDEEDGRRR